MVLLRKSQSQKFSELIERIREGDTKATTEIYYELIPHIKKIILKKLYAISAYDLDILSHEIASTVILSKLNHYNSSKDFAPFIWRITTNLLADNYRRNKGSFLIQKNSVELHENTLPFSDEILVSEQRFLREEKLSFLLDAVNELSHEKRRIIYLYYVKDWSINRIARETNSTVPAITSILHRVRRKIQSKMKEKGYKVKGKK